MTQIKIIDAPVVDGSTDKIVKRLQEFLVRIRAANLTNKDELTENDAPEEVDELSYSDQRRIVGRSTKLLKARLAAAGLSHLKKEEYARLEPSLAGMRIVMAKGVDWADEVAASLHDEMPWMGPATEHLWHSLRLSAERGEALTIRPVILNGPPGIGKSVWARTVARSLSVPGLDIDASKGGAGMALVGVERGWGTALAGRPIDLLLASRIANPLIVVDEVCKAQTAVSTRGSVHAFADALLSLLEPATAKKWECPYFRVRFDMSHISWVLTSNTIGNVPEPVRSRCQIVEIPDVTTQQLQDFAIRKGAHLGLSVAGVDAVVMAIAQAPHVTGRRFCLRDAMRMLERAEMLEGRPRLQ